MAGLMQTIQQSGYSNKPISRATIVNAVTAVAHTADADSCRRLVCQRTRRARSAASNQWQTIAQTPLAA
jgi:hypothetical protein